jgi:hypothetical protein
VSETSNGPIRYRVSYSELVRTELEKLLTRAKERGLEAQVRAAAREIDRRLHIFPQFGDLLADLSFPSGESRIGTVPPLVVRYALYPEQRLVIVTIPIAPLPHSGL